MNFYNDIVFTHDVGVDQSVNLPESEEQPSQAVKLTLAMKITKLNKTYRKFALTYFLKLLFDILMMIYFDYFQHFLNIWTCIVSFVAVIFGLHFLYNPISRVTQKVMLKMKVLHYLNITALIHVLLNLGFTFSNRILANIENLTKIGEKGNILSRCVDVHTPHYRNFQLRRTVPLFCYQVYNCIR